MEKFCTKCKKEEAIYTFILAGPNKRLDPLERFCSICTIEFLNVIRDWKPANAD